LLLWCWMGRKKNSLVKQVCDLSWWAVLRSHTSVLWLYGICPGQPGWAGTRKNIQPLTPIVVINCTSSASSIYYDPWHFPCSIHVPDNLFPQSLFKFYLVYLLSWHTPLHTPCISSPSHCLLFPTHAHTIATCFAVLPRLCHLSGVCIYIYFLLLQLFGCSVLAAEWLDSSSVGTAQIVSHAAHESIFFCEGWWRGFSQMTLGRTCESSCLDIGNFRVCIVQVGTLGVKYPIWGG